jgi:hypothetical protein
MAEFDEPRATFHQGFGVGMVLFGAYRDEQANVVDATLKGSGRKIDGLPMTVGFRSKEGQSEGTERHLVAPQCIESLELLYQWVVCRWDG